MDTSRKKFFWAGPQPLVHRLLNIFVGTEILHKLASPLVHLLWWQTCITILNFHSSMNFDGFHPFSTKKTDERTLFFFGACCMRGRHLYTTTAPSCCIPASYCNLSDTLQTMRITVVNLKDNRAEFRIFIALLRFSFDSPSYVHNLYIGYCVCVCVCMWLTKFGYIYTSIYSVLSITSCCEFIIRFKQNMSCWAKRNLVQAMWHVELCTSIVTPVTWFKEHGSFLYLH
jgi:hypothetical protein